MDWDQFCIRISQLIARGHISSADIDRFLKLYSLSIKASRRFFGSLIPFEKAKIGFLYSPSFLQLKKVCSSAPYSAKKAYNSLVWAIFSSSKAAVLQFELPKVEPKKKESPQALLDNFETKMRAVHVSLFANFVSSFKTQVLKAVESGQPQDELEKKLSLQEKELLFLDTKIRDEEKEYRKKATVFAQEFYRSGYGSFRDIATRFDAIWKSGFDEALTESGSLDDKKKEIVLAAVSKSFQEKLRTLGNIIATGKGRISLIQEMGLFREKSFRVLTRLKTFKDGRLEYDKISKEIAAFAATQDSFLGLSPEKAEQKIKDCEAAFRSFQKEAPRIFSAVLEQAEVLGQAFQDMTRTIKRRLYEFFSCVTPFPDLTDLLYRKRAFIVGELEEARRLFFEGSLTIKEYEEKCFSIAYEHDIKQLRYDLSFRATRLSEIRKALYEALFEISKLYRYLCLIEGSASLKQEAALLKEEMEHYLDHIENPYIVFQSASSYVFESINEVYRKAWIECEGFQKRLSLVSQKCSVVIKSNLEPLLRAFYRSVDTLEAVLKEPEGKRPHILVPLQSELSSFKGEALLSGMNSKIADLEKRYPFLKPFGFFMKLSDSQFRQDLMQKEKELYGRMEEVRHFAKDLQAVKMFEEGRVDEILELFERFGIIEEDGRADHEAALRHQERIERACFIVVEETLLEIGFVDRKALRDIDEKQLQKSLTIAVERAKSHAEKLIKTNVAFSVLQKRFAALLHKKRSAVASIDELLVELRGFCHFFFEVRLFTLTQKGNISAFAEHFISETRSFINDVESLLQKKEGIDPVFGPPVIGEVSEAKKIVEKLELAKETKEELELILKEIFSVLSNQINSLPDVDKQLMGKQKQSLFNELEKLSSLKKETAFEFPLYCTPGMLSIK